jgi:hypothetical protein
MLTLLLSHFPPDGIHHWFALIEGKEVDIMYQIQNGWNNFVKTGQVWALIIGFIIGYMFRGLTSY